MEILKANKKLFIVFGICIVLFILASIVSCVRTNKYISTKKVHGKSKLAFIKINDDEFKYLNDTLEILYNEVVRNNDDSYLTYEYDINNNIFSLLIINGLFVNNADILNERYLTYNYDLTSKKMLTNDDVLNMYGIDSDSVKELIENELKKEYEKEEKEGYFDSREYSYQNFIYDKEYSSFEENVTYFIKEKKVYAYLNVNNTSVYYTKEDCPKIKKIYKLN